MFTNQCLVTCTILHDFVVNYEDGGRTSQKIPPHEQVLEEGAIVFLILHPIKAMQNIFLDSRPHLPI